MSEEDCCALCLRPGQKLTKHHLIPRTRHSKKSVRDHMSLDEARSQILLVCRSCHNQIHAVLSEKELERDYNSLEKLLTHPDIASYVTWTRKRNISGSVQVRASRRRR